MPKTRRTMSQHAPDAPAAKKTKKGATQDTEEVEPAAKDVVQEETATQGCLFESCPLYYSVLSYSPESTT